MVKQKSIEEIADILLQIYKKPFMKKKGGDYKMSKILLRKIIGGRKNLKLSTFCEKLSSILNEYDYLLVDYNDDILILNKKVISRQRNVPHSAVMEYIYLVDDDDAGIVTDADVNEIKKNIKKFIPI